jgi:hypothetical protein
MITIDCLERGEQCGKDRRGSGISPQVGGEHRSLPEHLDDDLVDVRRHGGHRTGAPPE